MNLKLQPSSTKSTCDLVSVAIEATEKALTIEDDDKALQVFLAMHAWFNKTPSIPRAYVRAGEITILKLNQVASVCLVKSVIDTNLATISDVHYVGLNAGHAKNSSHESLCAAKEVIEFQLAIRFGNGFVHYENMFHTPFKHENILSLDVGGGNCANLPSYLFQALQQRKQQADEFRREFPASRIRRASYDCYDNIMLQRIEEVWRQKWGNPAPYQVNFHPDRMLGGVS